MGSQSIRRWYKDWKVPNGTIPESRGDLYDRLMRKVNDSIKNEKIASVTFIWMQGERDARTKFGEVYENSLLGLHNQISEDLKRTDVNFIIGRLSDFDMLNEKWTHWTRIRDIQMKVRMTLMMVLIIKVKQYKTIYTCRLKVIKLWENGLQIKRYN